MEWYQTRGRLRYAKFMISKRNARQAVKTLRKGGVIWYAPDQDFGPDQSVFAPFFGIQTATLLATHRLPSMTGCAVVPMFPVYDQQSGLYDIYVLPTLENYPTDDPVADLSRINSLIESQVRKAPAPYPISAVLPSRPLDMKLALAVWIIGTRHSHFISVPDLWCAKAGELMNQIKLYPLVSFIIRFSCYIFRIIIGFGLVFIFC